jgi:hypothetical protein
MLIHRNDIIEGLIRIRIGDVDPNIMTKLITKMGKRKTNNELCELYYTATKCHIRQVFSNYFIALT